MTNKKPIKRRFNTTIDAELLEKFIKLAESEGRKVNFYIEKGLRILLNQNLRKDNEDR